MHYHSGNASSQPATVFACESIGSVACSVAPETSECTVSCAVRKLVWGTSQGAPCGADVYPMVLHKLGQPRQGS